MAITRKQHLEMLQEISAAHLHLLKSISTLSDAELTKPDTAGIWSAKDVIAHIGDWIGVYNGVLHNRAAGEPPNWPTTASGLTLDEWNQAQVVARADWSVDEVKEYLQDQYDDLMQTLERSLDVDPEEVLHFTRDHYNMHFEDLNRARNQ